MKYRPPPRLILCCLPLLFTCAAPVNAQPASAQPATAQPVAAQPANATSDTQATRFFAKDPSTVPASIEGTPAERYRVRVDLNQDGQMDMLLSEPAPNFGNSHGAFMVLLAENGGYREIGWIGAPLSIALEHDDPYYDRHKLWVYLRSNSSSGVLGYYEIRANKLGEFKHVDITLAPDGSTLGNKLYKVIFSTPYLLKTEKSTTVGDHVTWQALKR